MSKYFDEEDIIAEYEIQLQKKDNEIELLQLELNREHSQVAKYCKRLIKAINHIKEYCIDDEFYVNLTNKEKNIIEIALEVTIVDKLLEISTWIKRISLL